MLIACHGNTRPITKCACALRVWVQQLQTHARRSVFGKVLGTPQANKLGTVVCLATAYAEHGYFDTDVHHWDVTQKLIAQLASSTTPAMLAELSGRRNLLTCPDVLCSSRARMICLRGISAYTDYHRAYSAHDNKLASLCYASSKCSQRQGSDS